MADEVLKIKNCSIINTKRRTKDTIVVIDDLKINRGDSVFIIGNNGSGKSTLIKALFSIRQEDNYFDINKDAIIDLKSNNFKNILSLNNQNESDPHDLLLGYTYIEQEESFRKKDSVIKSLGIIGLVALKHVKNDFNNLNEYEDKLKMLDHLVKNYSLEYFEDIYKYDDKYMNCDDKKEKEEIAFRILNKKKAIDCSGGQKKLISLLASLIKAQLLKTDLIVLDEPFNHLDHKNKIKIRDLITNIKNERKGESNPVTLIIVSHCLIFDFIKETDCFQYKIKDHKLVAISENEKIFHNCLHTEEC